MKCFVDRDLCISCGLCETLCSPVFELDEEDIAGCIVDEIEKKDLINAKRAKSQCPVKAITLE